jgi:hypothetical protein
MASFPNQNKGTGHKVAHFQVSHIPPATGTGVEKVVLASHCHSTID